MALLLLLLLLLLMFLVLLLLLLPLSLPITLCLTDVIVIVITDTPRTVSRHRQAWHAAFLTEKRRPLEYTDEMQRARLIHFRVSGSPARIESSRVESGWIMSGPVASGPVGSGKAVCGSFLPLCGGGAYIHQEVARQEVARQEVAHRRRRCHAKKIDVEENSPSPYPRLPCASRQVEKSASCIASRSALLDCF